MAKDEGILYVMSTVVDGLIKVGKTGKDNFDQRMYVLEHNGYCNVTGLKKQYAILVDNYGEKEDLFKKLFQRSRVADTELYSLNIKQVISLLSSFKGKQIYPKDETNEEVFEQVIDAVESSDLINGLYYLDCNVKNELGKERVKATLKVEEGKFIILKGAILSSSSHIRTKGYATVRNGLKKNGNILDEDILCDSVSMAATIICGTEQNGWDKWKDKKGTKIGEYRKEKRQD